MTTFRYKAISRDGAKVAGTIESYNEYEAAATLRESCSIITMIEAVPETKKNGITLGGTAQGKIKEKDLAIICSQFAIILSSGLPIVRCIQMVAAQAKDKNIKNLLTKVGEDVDSGAGMAQSFETNGPKLPRTFIETIRAGEQSGTLENCFHRLHAYYDKSYKARSKVVSALTYPTIVIVVAIIVFIIIMAVAVPMFTKTFAELGVDLPFITRALIGVSNFITKQWWVMVMIVIVFFIARALLRRTEQGRRRIANFKLTRSPLHKLNSFNASSQFATTMSTMLSAGLPVTQALDVTSAVVNNYVYALAVRKVKEGVEQGRGIAECMGEYPCFPAMLTEMTGVGEQSGSMEATLDVVGDYFSNEVSITSARLLSILEPAITVGLAVLTVILLLAVYLPLFSMYGSI